MRIDQEERNMSLIETGGNTKAHTFEVWSVKVQSSNWTLAFYCESFDWREVGIILGACIFVSGHAVSDNRAWLSSLPNFSWRCVIVLVHSICNPRGHDGAKDGSTCNRKERLSRLFRLGVQCNVDLWGRCHWSKRRGGRKSEESDDGGILHSIDFFLVKVQDSERQHNRDYNC